MLIHEDKRSILRDGLFALIICLVLGFAGCETSLMPRAEAGSVPASLPIQ